jgi:hypothetical protein
LQCKSRRAGARRTAIINQFADVDKLAWAARRLLWYRDRRFALSTFVPCARFTKKMRLAAQSFGAGSHDTVVRVYDDAGKVIETHEHKGDFKEP